MDAEHQLRETLHMPTEERMLRTDNVVVRGIVCGSGPVMMLVHGLDIGWGQWHAVMPALARRCTVIAIDLPGAGSNEKGGINDASRPSVTLSALDSALRAWAPNGAIVIGHSIGAWAALTLAARRHPSILRVFAVNPLGLNDWLTPKFRPLALRPFARALASLIFPPTQAGLGAFLGDVMTVQTGLSDEFLKYVVSNVNRPPVTHPAMLIHGLLRPFRIKEEYVLTHEQRTSISCSVTVIHGEDDPLIPLDRIRGPLSDIPKSRLMIMSETGHVPPIERPERFTGMIWEGLSE